MDQSQQSKLLSQLSPLKGSALISTERLSIGFLLVDFVARVLVILAFAFLVLKVEAIAATEDYGTSQASLFALLSAAKPLSAIPNVSPGREPQSIRLSDELNCKSMMFLKNTCNQAQSLLNEDQISRPNSSFGI
jgi:hypothetical protein